MSEHASTVTPFRRPAASTAVPTQSHAAKPAPIPPHLVLAPGDTILRLPAVMQRTGLSKSTIYRRIDDKTFPEPVDLGGNAVGWSEKAITAWVSHRPTRRHRRRR